MHATPFAAATGDRGDWRLRPGVPADIDGLHALACEPLVYRYLFDGVAPGPAMIADGIAGAMADTARTGLGLWVLESPRMPYAGAVQLRPDHAGKSAELLYLLHPAHWGRGLATRMAWTAIAQAFRTQIDVVVARADGANAASQAVMRRLGMGFRRQVSLPLGRGVEYALTRDDAGPERRPALVQVA